VEVSCVGVGDFFLVLDLLSPFGRALLVPERWFFDSAILLLLINPLQDARAARWWGQFGNGPTYGPRESAYLVEDGSSTRVAEL